jgi:hypothetical protein
MARRCGPASPTPAFLSLLHLHHNGLTGSNPVREQTGYAIARGMVAVSRDRERHLERNGPGRGLPGVCPPGTDGA